MKSDPQFLSKECQVHFRQPTAQDSEVVDILKHMHSQPVMILLEFVCHVPPCVRSCVQ